MPLLSVPHDVILLIALYLSPLDLLSFCATTKALQFNHKLRFAPHYWRLAVQRTFRVPNQPVVALDDGERWKHLYRRLCTQSKVYGWGNSDGGCLGPPSEVTRSTGWPAEVKFGSNSASASEVERLPVGVIADLQCGGWSITALNSNGELYTRGVIDGERQHGTGRAAVRLGFPDGLGKDKAAMTVKQFSAGRAHVLALSDTGRIWSWTDADEVADQATFQGVEIVETESKDLFRARGTVWKVVAGWNRSSAYVVGFGIIVWDPKTIEARRGDPVAGRSNVEADEEAEMDLIEPWVIPETSYIRPKTTTAHTMTDNGPGEVTAWAILDRYVLFVTDSSGLFVWQIPSDGDSAFAEPIRLDNADATKNDSGEAIIDVQGSFQTFAVFKRSGAILIGKISSLQTYFEQYPTPQLVLQKIPALQHSGVINLAFGDFHFHALHRDGTISSYGYEQSSTGCLGLGKGSNDMTDRQDNVLRLRGLAVGEIWTHDHSVNRVESQLPDQCLTHGRRLCFEPEKRRWLGWVGRGGVILEDYQESERRRKVAIERVEVRAEISEWVEERLRRWEIDAPWLESSPSNKADGDTDDGLPAYFAVAITAYGWHSASLVLVNEAKAKSIRNRYLARDEVPKPSGSFSSLPNPGRKWPKQWRKWIWQERGETFPRLRLRSGEVLPGDATIVELPHELSDWQPVEEVPLNVLGPQQV